LCITQAGGSDCKHKKLVKMQDMGSERTGARPMGEQTGDKSQE